MGVGTKKKKKKGKERSVASKCKAVGMNDRSGSVKIFDTKERSKMSTKREEDIRGRQGNKRGNQHKSLQTMRDNRSWKSAILLGSRAALV